MKSVCLIQEHQKTNGNVNILPTDIKLKEATYQNNNLSSVNVTIAGTVLVLNIGDSLPSGTDCISIDENSYDKVTFEMIDACGLITSTSDVVIDLKPLSFTLGAVTYIDYSLTLNPSASINTFNINNVTGKGIFNITLSYIENYANGSSYPSNYSETLTVNTDLPTPNNPITVPSLGIRDVYCKHPSLQRQYIKMTPSIVFHYDNTTPSSYRVDFTPMFNNTFYDSHYGITSNNIQSSIVINAFGVPSNILNSTKFTWYYNNQLLSNTSSNFPVVSDVLTNGVSYKGGLHSNLPGIYTVELEVPGRNCPYTFSHTIV